MSERERERKKERERGDVIFSIDYRVFTNSTEDSKRKVSEITTAAASFHVSRKESMKKMIILKY